MDYGKYRFEQAKKEKEAKKNQKTMDVKEVRLSLNIDVHDFDTKLNHAKKFLAGGDKVKVALRFRGREMAHPELGEASLSASLKVARSWARLTNCPRWKDAAWSRLSHRRMPSKFKEENPHA